jgi:hypothetical protein
MKHVLSSTWITIVKIIINIKEERNCRNHRPNKLHIFLVRERADKNLCIESNKITKIELNERERQRRTFKKLQ